MAFYNPRLLVAAAFQGNILNPILIEPKKLSLGTVAAPCLYALNVQTLSNKKPSFLVDARNFSS